MQNNERGQLDVFTSLSPDDRDLLQSLAEALLMRRKQEENKQNRSQHMAAKNATLEQVSHGAAIMAEIIEMYKTDPWALSGLSYTAGIAEGKRLERKRHK